MTYLLQNDALVGYVDNVGTLGAYCLSVKADGVLTTTGLTGATVQQVTLQRVSSFFGGTGATGSPFPSATGAGVTGGSVLANGPTGSNQQVRINRISIFNNEPVQSHTITLGHYNSGTGLTPVLKQITLGPFQSWSGDI